MKKIIAYFRGVNEEFKKVVWPEKSVALRHTVMVLIVLIVLTLLVALIDYGLAQLFQKIIF